MGDRFELWNGLTAIQRVDESALGRKRWWVVERERTDSAGRRFWATEFQVAERTEPGEPALAEERLFMAIDTIAEMQLRAADSEAGEA